MSLPSIGNDIVDFQTLTNKHLDKRFRQRVFTLKENKTIDEAQNKSAMLWQLWAAKEAAFKAYQQQHLDCIFSPRLFEIDVTTSTAHYLHQEMILKWQWLNKTTCHALALYGGNRTKLNTANVLIEEGDYDNPSQAVRTLALKAINAKHNNIAIKRLPFSMPDGSVKSSPPAYYLNDEKLPISLSLSHDGKYIGMATLK